MTAMLLSLTVFLTGGIFGVAIGYGAWRMLTYPDIAKAMPRSPPVAGKARQGRPKAGQARTFAAPAQQLDLVGVRAELGW